MKYVRIFALFMTIVALSSCKRQSKTELPASNAKPVAKDLISYNGPNSITRNIIQDRKGNIWAASWQGVFRYDGRSFTNVTDKVSSARFFSLLEDRNGNFWFGTIGSGVYYYDGRFFRNFTTTDGLVNNEITCIYEDRAGNLWFGVNGGVSRYDGKSFANYMMKGNVMFEERFGKTFPDFTRPPNEVNAIIEDKTGKFWFATRGNTFTYDGETFMVFSHGGKAFTNVRTIIEDKKGNIWLGGNDGLWRYDGSTFTNFTQKFVGYIMEDSKGNIWTSSVSANDQAWALSRYDEKSLYKSQFLSSPVPMPSAHEVTSKGMIFGIMEDDKGNIWFGADGVYRYDGDTITEFRGKESQE